MGNSLVRRGRIGLAVGAAFLLLATCGEANDSETAPAGGNAAGALAPPVSPAAKAPEADLLPDLAFGAADAPVTVVEYASMTCPHCADFAEVVFPDLKKLYIDTGKVRYVFREFPLDGLALRASMLARCAGPDRAFAFVESLFRLQRQWVLAEDPMAALAENARLGGMSQADFDACMADKALERGILANRKRGDEQDGVTGTPFFLINGAPLKGAPSLANLEAAIKPLLPQ